VQSYTFNNYFDLVVWHLQPRQEQWCCNFALPSGSQVIIFCSGLPSSILLQETIVPSDPFLKTIVGVVGQSAYGYRNLTLLKNSDLMRQIWFAMIL